MKLQKIFVLIIGLIVLIAIGVGYFFFFTPSAQVNRDASPFGSLFPFSRSSGNPSVPTQPVGQVATSTDLEVRTAQGTMLVKDFTKSEGIATSSDTFYVSYPHAGDIKNPGSLEYQIFYFPSDRSFLVALLKEPLGEARRRAAVDLSNRLGVSEAELCTLVAEVTTPPQVSEYYGALSLGFPHCPGATKFEGD